MKNYLKYHFYLKFKQQELIYNPDTPIETLRIIAQYGNFTAKFYLLSDSPKRLSDDIQYLLFEDKTIAKIIGKYTDIPYLQYKVLQLFEETKQPIYITSLMENTYLKEAMQLAIYFSIHFRDERLLYKFISNIKLTPPVQNIIYDSPSINDKTISWFVMNPHIHSKIQLKIVDNHMSDDIFDNLFRNESLDFEVFKIMSKDVRSHKYIKNFLNNLDDLYYNDVRTNNHIKNLSLWS